MGYKKFIAAVASVALLSLLVFASSGFISEAKTAAAGQYASYRGLSAAQAQQKISASLPGIVCWGDSITEGYEGGGSTWPLRVSKRMEAELMAPLRESLQYPGLIAPPVINMGIAGETTLEIAGRNGAIPYLVDERVTIPGGRGSRVDISFSSAYKGEMVQPLELGDAGIRFVVINGVRGRLLRWWDRPSWRSRYIFERSEPGAAVTIEPGTPIMTEACAQYGDYVMVIMMGANGGYDSSEELVLQYQAMLQHQSIEKDRYVVVGMPLIDADLAKWRRDEAAMKKAFGEHYVSYREWLIENGLQRAGITPTAADKERMKKGLIPLALLQPDEIHFTGTGYSLLGDMVYEKMDELGYFDGLKN